MHYVRLADLAINNNIPDRNNQIASGEIQNRLHGGLILFFATSWTKSDI